MPEKVVQLHPTLRCNLECRHCYSTSGPAHRESLSASLLRQALDDAAALGYQAVSVSGGEPFLYPALPEVLRHAKSLGLRTAVTTNGTVFGGGRLAAVAPWLDLLAVSCDGPAELHNHVRADPRAFARLLRGLDQVRESDVPFGLIHTVTGRSWDRLAWLGRFAVDQGAGLLQLHPLEATGRARSDLLDQRLDAGELAKTWLLGTALAVEYRDRLRVQIDVVPRSVLLDQPELVHANEDSTAENLGVLVVEPDGAVVPFSFGFSRDYEIGNLIESPLHVAWPRFAHQRYRSLKTLCQTVRDACLDSRGQLFSWHDLLVSRSHESGPAKDRTGPGRLQVPHGH